MLLGAVASRSVLITTARHPLRLLLICGVVTHISALGDRKSYRLRTMLYAVTDEELPLTGVANSDN